VCQRSVRWEDWLYMRTYHDGFHLFPDEMLFNVRNDPHEEKDLAPEMQGVVMQGRDRLKEWLGTNMNSMPAGYSDDPMEVVLREGGPYHARWELKRYCKRLEATGRGYAVKELMHKHPGEFK